MQQSTREIENQVQAALSAVLDRELVEISPSDRLFEDLMLDSTSVIELLMALEDTMGLEIEPDELEPETFETFGSLVGYVAGRLSTSEQPV